MAAQQAWNRSLSGADTTTHTYATIPSTGRELNCLLHLPHRSPAHFHYGDDAGRRGVSSPAITAPVRARPTPTCRNILSPGAVSWLLPRRRYVTRR